MGTSNDRLGVFLFHSCRFRSVSAGSALIQVRKDIKYREACFQAAIVCLAVENGNLLKSLNSIILKRLGEKFWLVIAHRV